jgi:hypothetical protein
MTSATISLDKKTYPLMMHLSILPKHDNNSEEQPVYDPMTQISPLDISMGNSWCTRSPSTFPILRSNDDDSQEDD